MVEARTQAAESPAPGRGTLFALAAGVALMTAFVWRFVLGLELLGWDSYPMIAAGRVGSPGEFFGTFGEKLMDGRFPHGDYYRPIAHLAFALDHALHGLAPFGYHLTDLCILALSAGLACMFVARATGSRAGAAAAGLAWALHPTHFEAVTAAPRRADGLAVLFLLAALVLAAGCAPERVTRGRKLATALLCALALGSKETGVVAPLVLFLFALALAEGGWRARLRTAGSSTWTAFAAVGGVLVLRTAVLGGLGGDRRLELSAGLTKLPATALGFAREIVGGPLSGRSAVLVLLAAMLALAGLTLALARRERSARGAVHAGRLPSGRGALFVLAWGVLVVGITGTSGVEHAWYVLPALAAWAVACGLLVAGGARALAAGRRGLGALALGCGAGLVALNAAAAPPCTHAPEFEQASLLQRALLAQFERALAGARPGDRFQLEGTPRRLDGLDGRRVYLATSYSLQAWAELTHPALPVRVELPSRANASARAGEILVVFVPAERPDARPDARDTQPLR